MMVELFGRKKFKDMSTINDFTGYKPTWCPGCGNHGIGIALKSALVKLNLLPSDVTIVFGIGCSGNMNDFINAYAFHGLHGRTLPVAVGIKIANHKMPVIVVAGDGDFYGEGGNHFLHACRGNHNITVIVHDNRVYGLTTGQTAPTAQKGFKTKSTPNGIIEVPINPLILAMTQGASFVAQGFAGDTPFLVDLIKQGIEHQGFSLINILQPCVSFNKINTYDYYREKVYKLPADYQKDSLEQALVKAREQGKEKFPLGVIYQIKSPSFTDQLTQLSEKTLVERERFSDFTQLIKDFV